MAGLIVAGAAGADDANRYYPPRYYPGVTDSANAVLIPLVAGQTSPFLTMALEREGAIVRGRVFGETAGDPVPLEGVLVEVISGGLRSFTHTVADGRFSVHGTPPGPAIIRYSTDDPLSRAIAHQAAYHPGVRSEQEAEIVDLVEATPTDLDPVTLQAASVLLGTLTRGDTGGPMPGVAVRIIRPETGEEWSAETRESGRYWRGGLPPGTYLVQARPEDSDYVAEFFGGVPDSSLATPVIVAAGEERDGVDIAADRGGVIWGEIRREDLSGIAGAAVEATRSSTGQVYRAETNDFGVYRIPGLPAGRYVVYVPLLRKYYPDARRLEDAREVVVAPPDELFGINVRGTPGGDCGLPEGSQGFIIGSIRQTDWTDVGRAQVIAFSPQETTSVEIDLPGPYLIGCLPPGDYRVAFLVDGPIARQFWQETDRIWEADLVSVAVADTADGIDFVGVRGVRLVGEVLDPTGGIPLEGVTVIGEELNTRTVATDVTDAHGRFSLERAAGPPDPGLPVGLPPGRWRLRTAPILYPDPLVTPVMQPWFEATTEASSVRLAAGLPPGRWRARVLRLPDGFTVVEGAEVDAGGSPLRVEWGDGPPPGTWSYRLELEALGEGGAPNPDGDRWEIEAGPVSVRADPLLASPPRIRVVPVPWNGTGEIRFEIPAPLRWDGRLRVFTATGRQVASLHWPSGTAEKIWSPTGSADAFLPSGAYFCRLEVEGSSGGVGPTDGGDPAARRGREASRAAFGWGSILILR